MPLTDDSIFSDTVHIAWGVEANGFDMTKLIMVSPAILWREINFEKYVIAINCMQSGQNLAILFWKVGQ